MGQNYPDIAPSDTLQNSLSPIEARDDANKSNFAGTAFPTADLTDGMFCYRTDQFKLYQLKDKTVPTWVLVADLAETLLTQEDADALYAALGHNHDASYQPLDADLTALAGLATTGLIERTGDGTAGVVSVSAYVKTLLDDGDAATARATLGLGSVATETTVPLAKGGTGATTQAGARTALGIGTNANGSKTVSTSAPSGGTDGDTWFQY